MTAPPLLAALAAALAPGRAACLARTGDPVVAAEATRLASLSRPDRLSALAGALAAQPVPTAAARERAAALERPGMARLLLDETPGSVSPLLVRLASERILAVAPLTASAAGRAEPPGPRGTDPREHGEPHRSAT